MTSDRVDWLVPGYVALQAITELDGAVKRSGKTTLITYLVAAVLDGAYFLGQPTIKTKVIYVTEQQPGPFREALNRAGLIGRGDELRIVFRRDAMHLPWPELVRTIATDARRDGYGLLVVDTLAKLAGIRDENDSGTAATAMAPLQDAAHDGLAVIVARHDRKGGGEVGESGRGSSAFAGDADVILQLRRPEGNQPHTRRVIESLSRYTATPEKVVIELADEGYVLLGESEAVALADAIRIVSAHIGGENEQKASWSVDELVHESELNRAAVQRALRDLMARDEVERSGSGKRGDPYTYASKKGVSALTPVLVGRNDSEVPA
jgi:RecA-family ATPase